MIRQRIMLLHLRCITLIVIRTLNRDPNFAGSHVWSHVWEGTTSVVPYDAQSSTARDLSLAKDHAQRGICFSRPIKSQSR